MTPARYPARARRRHRGAVDRGVMERLARLMGEGDADGIRALLRPDVSLIVDSGGAAHPARPPAEDADADAEAAAALIAFMTARTTTATVSINGAPGLVLTRDGAVVAAVIGELRADLLSSVWVVCNPDKLRHWNPDGDV